MSMCLECVNEHSMWCVEVCVVCAFVCCAVCMFVVSASPVCVGAVCM